VTFPSIHVKHWYRESFNVLGENNNSFIFIIYCLDFVILSLVFLFATAREMKFEMSSEMENGTAQSCRS
jgi:hypothetical protein